MEDQVTNNQIVATQTPKGYKFDLLLEEILKLVILPAGLIRCVFAVSLSIKLKLSPLLWLMVVGVPSSAKTDLLLLLRRLAFVYFLDSMTLNPFASGYNPGSKGKSYDLLPELNDKCFITKDYTTIFSLNEETTKKLLGELVAIYDGEFAKFSPTRGLVSYESSFSHIGAITPAALNRHQRYLDIVGPRFIFYRVPNLDETRRKNGFKIAWNGIDRKQAIKRLQELTKVFFEQLIEANPTPFEITDQPTQHILEKLAVLLTRSRGSITGKQTTFTNQEDTEITYFEVTGIQIEEPWRALKQLQNLAVSLAILDGRDHLLEDDIQILKHVVLSSMPPERAEVLDNFLRNDTLTAKQLSVLTEKSVRTCQRHLKELESLGIIITGDKTESLAKVYSLNSEFEMMKEESSDTDTASESLSQVIPQKQVSDYTDDEIEGVNSFLKVALSGLTPLSQDTKDKYLQIVREIEDEGKRRGLIPQNQLSLDDQLAIDEVIGSGEKLT